MSNVDERVVRMEFDNKAFEKNAGETLSTLDKLKEALKFDNVKNSFGKITKAANKVDVSNIGEGVDTVNAKFSALQVAGYTVISNLTNSLVNFGKNVVGKTFGQAFSGGLTRSLNIEQARFTIEGLDKDFVQLKEDINYAVSGTAYGFDEAAKAASMMAASGIEAGDEMKASLRGISGMAAMTGDSYSNIADIFGNIAGKGKLGLQEVNRFATRGINVAAKLAEQLGTTEEVIRDMISHGEISFQEFAAAMDDAFGEHATEANKTFTGAMMNIKATLSRIGEAFIHPLIETNEKDVLLLQTYEDLDDELVKLAKHSDNLFENGVTARTELNKAIKESKAVSEITNDEIKYIIDGNKKKYIESIKDYKEYAGYTNKQLAEVYEKDSKAVFKALSKHEDYADKSREELQGILADSKQIFIQNARDMGMYADKSDKELGELYERYTGFQYNLVTVFQAFMRMLKSIESAIKGSSFLQTFIDKFSDAAKAASLFFNAISASFSGGILTISEEVEKLNEKGEKVTETVEHVLEATTLWEKFGKAIGITNDDLTNLKNTFTGVLSVFKLAFDVVSAFVQAISPVGGIGTSIASVILLITGTIGKLLTSMYDVIHSTQIIGNLGYSINIVFGGIVKIIQTFVKIIVGLFTKVVNNPIFDEIVNTLMIIGYAINRLWMILNSTASKIVDTFLYPFRKMATTTDAVGGVVDDVLIAIADALHMFNTALEVTTFWVMDFVDKFLDLDKVLEVGNNLAALFAGGLGLDKISKGSGNRIENIFGSLSGMGGKATEEGKGITGAIKGIAGSIMNAVSSINYKAIGNTISKGFNYIINAFAFSLGVLTELFIGVKDVFTSIDYTGIAKSFAATVGKFIEAIAAVFITIPAFIAGAITELIDNIPSMQSVADNVGIALGDMLAAGIRLVLKAVPIILRIIVTALKRVSIKLPGILNEFAYEVKSIFGTTIINAFEKIKKAVAKVSFLDILKGLNLFALYEFIKSCKKTVDSLNGLAAIPKALESFVSQMKTSLAGLMRAKMIQMYIISLGLLIGLIYLVSFVPYDKFLNGLSKMVTVAFLLGLFMRAMAEALDSGGNNDPKVYVGFIAAIDGFIVGLTLLVGALYLLGQLENGWTAVFQLGAIIVAIGAFMFAMTKLDIKPGKFKVFSKAMIEFSIAMAIMAVGVAILASLDMTKMVVSVLALSTLIAVLTVCAINLRSNIKSMQAFAALGPMILAMCAGLAILSMFNWKSVMVSVAAISILLGVLVGLGAVAGHFPVVAAGLTAISKAVSALGMAVLAVGAGVYLFVSAIQTLAMMGRDGSINSLATAVGVLAGSIPVLFQGIGEGILVMVQTLADGATIIADAVMNIVSVILIRLLNMAEMFATVGVKIILTLLDGLLSCMYKITESVVLIITEFVNGIAANMETIVQSGINLIVGFINGIATGIDNNGDVIRASVMHLMGSIINFVIDSLQALVSMIPGVGKDFAKQFDVIKENVSKLFGDGKVNKENEKGMEKTAATVKKGGKKAVDANRKNADQIAKDTEKGYKKAGKATAALPNEASKSIKKLSKDNTLVGDIPKKGKEAIEGYGKEFIKNAKSSDGKKAVEKVADGASEVSMSKSATNMYAGFSTTFLGKNWYQQGVEAAKKVNKGFKDTVKEHSPSKLWGEFADFLYIGFNNHMKKMDLEFYQTGSKAAKAVNTGFESSMNLLSNLDFDSITEPTIRPVMDLSNVKMGVDSIASMFDNNQYALGIAGSLPTDGLLSSKNITFNNKITVDGAENPSQFADEFIQELMIQARTV